MIIHVPRASRWFKDLYTHYVWVPAPTIHWSTIWLFKDWRCLWKIHLESLTKQTRQSHGVATTNWGCDMDNQHIHSRVTYWWCSPAILELQKQTHMHPYADFGRDCLLQFFYTKSWMGPTVHRLLWTYLPALKLVKSYTSCQH